MRMATYDRRAFNGDDVDGERRRVQVNNLNVKDENSNAWRNQVRRLRLAAASGERASQEPGCQAVSNQKQANAAATIDVVDVCRDQWHCMDTTSLTRLPTDACGYTWRRSHPSATKTTHWERCVEYISARLLLTRQLTHFLKLYFPMPGPGAQIIGPAVLPLKVLSTSVHTFRSYASPICPTKSSGQ